MKQHEEAVKYKALSEQRIKDVKEFVSHVKSLDSSMALRDSAIAKERRQFAQERDKLRLEEARAKLRTKEAIDELAKTLTADQQLSLSHITAGYEEQLALRDSQMVLLKADISLLSSQVTQKDSLLELNRRLTDSLVRVWLRAERNDEPKLKDKILKAAPWAIVAVVAIFK